MIDDNKYEWNWKMVEEEAVGLLMASKQRRERWNERETDDVAADLFAKALSRRKHGFMQMSWQVII